MTLNADKCKFARSTTKFLGQVLDENGISTDTEKTVVIRGMHAPENVVGLGLFLGMVNHSKVFAQDSQEDNC